MSKKNKKCYNCIHGGNQFKIGNKTYLHCEHPKYTQEDFESGKVSPWDTLREFWATCEDYQPKKMVARVPCKKRMPSGN